MCKTILMKTDIQMDWTRPEHFSLTKDGTTEERDSFFDGIGDSVSAYVVYNNRFSGVDSEFSKKLLQETSTKAEIVWDYDLVCGPGKEYIEIHIGEEDDEPELLDRLIAKTKEALRLMQSRKAFLAKHGKEEKSHADEKSKPTSRRRTRRP